MHSRDEMPEAVLLEDLEQWGLSEVFQTSVAAAGWNWFTWGRKEESKPAATYMSWAGCISAPRLRTDTDLTLP